MKPNRRSTVDEHGARSTSRINSHDMHEEVRALLHPNRNDLRLPRRLELLVAGTRDLNDCVFWHSHNLSLISRPHKDQATVRIGHRSDRLDEVRREPFLILQRQALRLRLRYQFPNALDGDVL